MTLQAVHTLTDTWYSATEDADGNYVQGTELGSYTNVTGTVYSGTKVADITGATVGQAMPDDANSVLLGIYDVSSGTLITDQQLLPWLKIWGRMIPAWLVQPTTLLLARGTAHKRLM